MPLAALAPMQAPLKLIVGKAPAAGAEAETTSVLGTDYREMKAHKLRLTGRALPGDAKPKREPSVITAARFIGEATDLGYRAASPRPTLVTASCQQKGCGGVQFRFQVINGELSRARLKQLREHVEEHRRQEKRPKKTKAAKHRGKR